jgi:hypothetical protein
MRAEAAEAERLRKEAEERARQLAQQQEAEARLRAEQLRLNPPPPPKPRPPAMTAKYLGCMGPRSNRIAFFERDKELIMARRGSPSSCDFKVGQDRLRDGHHTASPPPSSKTRSRRSR